jgi:hypothetical protein
VSEVEGWGSPRRVRRRYVSGFMFVAPRKKWAPPLVYSRSLPSLDRTRSRWSLLFVEENLLAWK